jgi:hypothetical protein
MAMAVAPLLPTEEVPPERKPKASSCMLGTLITVSAAVSIL